MHILRLFFFSFLTLFIVIWGISLLVPSHVRISKAINVKSPEDRVWKYVDDMKTWKSWNPFFENTPTESMIFNDSGDHAGMQVKETTIKWLSKNAGERKIAIEREGRNPIYHGWKCMQIPGSDSTTIQWYLDFDLKWYPWEKFGSLLFERSYGPKMERGLINLKKMVEANRTSYN